MANHQIHSIFVLISISCFAYSSYAYQFFVGGRDGWMLNPSENYNHWAQRMRFQVNDTLLFKYKNGSDSVLVVNKDDYDKCNTANPLLKLDGGNSVFKFDRSGPFYFISGNKPSCDQGQKLIILVLAVRNRPTSPPNSPSPTAAPPTGSSPSPSPTAGGAPTPASSPSSPSPSGGAPAPASSPSSPSPSRGAPTPAISPSSPSPAVVPPPETQGWGPSPTTTSTTPPSSTTPGSPNNSSTPRSGTPADVNTPGSSPPRNIGAPSCSPSFVLVSTVSVILSVALGGFMVSP